LFQVLALTFAFKLPENNLYQKKSISINLRERKKIASGAFSTENIASLTFDIHNICHSELTSEFQGGNQLHEKFDNGATLKFFLSSNIATSKVKIILYNFYSFKQTYLT